MIALRFGIGCSQFRLELRTTLFVFYTGGLWMVFEWLPIFADFF